jgi:hypothetical protein
VMETLFDLDLGSYIKYSEKNKNWSLRLLFFYWKKTAFLFYWHNIVT